MVWVLSHLVADGGAHLLLLYDLLADGPAGRMPSEPRHPQILDIARSEQAPQLRQLSSRAMRYWEAQLRHIPVQTFGVPGSPEGRPGPRYNEPGSAPPAAHQAMLAIAGRTGTDSSRGTLAVIAIAIGRATRVPPLTIKVMVNNRFRPGLADVIASIAQNSVVTIDVTGTSVDEVVACRAAAPPPAGMRLLRPG